MVIKWIIIILAVLNFGFMIFDGTRAMLTGDYIRPESGQHANQLGPWTKVVEKIGLDPESNTMKSLFVICGMAGMYFTVAFAVGKPWAWKGMLIFNICSLWYAMIGTVSSAMQVVLLILTKLVK
jgi:hypothetical protein